MQGNGGTVASSIVAEHAVATVMSGPASGVIAAAATALQAGARPGEFGDVVTYDMGGTVERRRPRPRRPADGLERPRARVRDADPRADDRRAHDRRRRRLDRLGRRLGDAPGRPRERGRDAGADLLRPRRHPADDHRRQPASSAGSTRTGCSRSSTRSRSIDSRRAARSRSARRSASTRPRRRRRSSASPTTAWPARSAW